jgi:hypothetical protein
MHRNDDLFAIRGSFDQFTEVGFAFPETGDHVTIVVTFSRRVNTRS